MSSYKMGRPQSNILINICVNCKVRFMNNGRNAHPGSMFCTTKCSISYYNKEHRKRKKEEGK